MAQSIEIPVSLGLKDAQAQINQLRQALQQSVKLDSSAGKSLASILDSAQKSVDRLSGKISNSFKSVSGSSSFLKDYEKMIELLTTATQKMTNLGVTDIKFSVSDQQVVDTTIQKIQNLQQTLTSIQNGKAVEVINMSQADGIDNLRQQLTQLKIDASKLTFDEIGEKLGEAAESANAKVQELTNNIANINSQIGKLNTQGFQEITKLSDFSTKGVSRILDIGNVDSVNDRLQKLAATITEVIVKPVTVTAGQNIDSVIENQTRAIEKKYNEQIQAIQQNKDKILSIINDVSNAGARVSANGKTSYGHWTNEQMQQLMSMPSVENIISKLKADTTLNFDSLGIRQQFAKFREALNQELNSLGTQEVNLQSLRDKVKDQVTRVFEGAGEAVVGSRSQLQKSIKSLFSNLGINDDELKKIFDINSISAGEKMIDVIDRIKAGLTTYIDTLDQTANTDLAAKLSEAKAAFDELTNAQATNKNVSQESGSAAQNLQSQIDTLAKQIQELIDKYNQLSGKNITFDNGNIDGAKGKIESYIQSLNKLQQKQKALGNIQMAVNRWMGFWQVLNMTKKAINDMKQHIQELDTVMTSISVVTNFSQEDLWGQISQYSEIARQYGVAIKGVYEVSQIYYQQGLQQNDVMTLTTETLKMARIAGLDYATAADYMTTAIRGFKLEMTDAAHVTDVFSALAATTASSTEEIATAISKTAASAEAVGASFEATSAMMATMIATTRESATNIGTALKSVISRYGEMTSDPSKTVDAEGEEMSLNRVDKALQTVGITIHDTAGQFRDFDDVMLELMEKWSSLDSLSQRYIATLMAGNRQQSRFLALVSNVDEYKKALQTAMDSEGTGELQTLKTLDSIDAKIEKMKVTIQEFYTSSGLEELYKNVLDIITNIVSAANSLPKMFGKIPGIAISIGANIINTVKTVMTLFINSIAAGLEQIKGKNTSILQTIIEAWRSGGKQATKEFTEEASKGLSEGRSKMESAASGQKTGKFWQKPSSTTATIATYGGAALSAIGSLFTINSLNKYGSSTSIEQDQHAGTLGILGTLSSIGGGAATGFAMGGPVGALLGGIASAVTQIPTIASAVNMINVSTTRRVQLAEKAATEAKTEASKQKAETQGLQKAVDVYKELEANSYSSSEALQEFQDHINSLAESYPQLISSMDTLGNYNIELTTLEQALAQSREKTAIATANATKAELNSQKATYNAFNQASKNSSQFNNIPTGQWDANSYSFITNWEELWEDYALLEDYLPDNLWHQVGEDYSETIQRFVKEFSPETVLPEELDFESDVGTVFEILNKFRNYVSQYANTDLIDLKTWADELITIDSSLSYKELTGYDSLEGLNPYEIFDAYRKFNQVTKEYADYYSETSNKISSRLVADEAEVTIAQEDIKDLSDSFDYKKHSNLIKGLLSYNQALNELGKNDTDDSREFEQAVALRTKEYLEYFKNHNKTLEFLENKLDLNSFRSIDELDKTLSQEIDTSDEIGQEVVQVYEEQWAADRANIIKLYNDQLVRIFKDDIPTWLDQGKFIISDSGEIKQSDKGQFTNKILSLIQSNLSTYQDLLSKQQYANAEAYFNSIESFYTSDAFKILKPEQQDEVYSIMKEVDFSNSEEIQTAVSALENAGPEFKSLSEILKQQALRWAANAAILLEQLASSTQETAKSIESSTSDMSKVFKYSEALEKAQALLDANEGVKFEELFTFDKDVGGYIKTAKAFQLEMAEFQNQQYETIDQSIEDYQNILSQLEAIEGKNIRDQYLKDMANTSLTGDRSRWAKGQFKQYLSMVSPEATSADIDRLWIEYTNMINAFEAQKESGEEDWNNFVDQYLEQYGSDLAEQLKAIQEMPQKMAREALQSFNYKSVISGKGTTQNKETFKALLSQASNGRLAEQASEDLFNLLVQGQIVRFNSMMHSLGLDDLQVSKEEADRARFEGFKSLYNTLINDNPVWAALDDTQKQLLETVGINEEKYKTEGVSSAAQAVWMALGLFTDGVIANLSELQQEIISNANKAYKESNSGKQKDLLEKFKDGFTADELVALQGDKELFLTKDNELTEEAAKVLYQDETGAYVRRAGQDAASVLIELARLLDISINKTTDQYKETIKDSIDQATAEADKADIGKQRVNIWQSIMSGKITDRISLGNVDETTRTYMRAAGLISDMSADFVYIESEKQLDKAIDWMATKLADSSFVTHNKQTAEYFQQMVYGQFDKLSSVAKELSEVSQGQFVTGRLRELLSSLNMIDNNNVVNETFNMVEAYKAIYEKMSTAAGATTAGLNSAYAEILAAEDQSNIDITDVLQNAQGMTYDALGQVLANYDIKLKDVLSDEVTAASYGLERTGFGKVRLTNWDSFAKKVFKTENLDAIRNTDEYISAFKAYNDGLIELNKNTEKNIKDEILQITSAKAGDQLNLSYLWSALQNTVDEAIKNITPENYRGNVDLANRPIVSAEKMKQVFSEFEDDYATLYSQSFMSEDFGDYARNVGVLFTSITASGEVIENLASYAKALYDEAAGDIDRMRELDKIENGGKGLMLFGEMSSSYEHLAEIADDIHIRAAFKDDINYYLKALQAVGANYADGILTLSEDADMLAIADILDVLSDLAGIDLGEEGKAAIRDAVDDLLKNIASLISNGMKGSLTNTDAASLSQWYKSTAKNYGAVTGELDFTKTAEGLKLTETSLANVYDLMKRIDGIKADALLDDIISTRESFQSLTGALREFNDVMRLEGIDASTNKLKNFNGELSNTAKMMQDVVQKAMTNPDSMNFMSNKLPDDMQTAVNAWENASQAIKTITAAEKSGYMGVQDFYNIVNTASSMMEAAGKTFEVAGMDAATLLQKGAQSLKVVDGKLTVDISSAGLNIVGSADQLKQNMTSGINELADAEIAIIDAEIQVLEILAAMEQMGDMDVDIDNDGLSFEISDIFKDDGNFTDIEDGANNMKDYLAKLKEVVDTSQETIDTFRQFQINGTSLYDLLSASADTWKQVFGSEENVSKFMQKFTKGIKGWDLEGNLQSDVLEFMKGLGQEYSIELGDSGVFHMNASGISYVIDFSDEKRMDAAREAAESLKLDIGESDEEFKKYLQDLVEKGSTENKESTLSFKQNYVLKVATGQIEVIKDEKTGKDQYKVGGKLYNSKSVAAAAADLMQAGAKADWEKLSKRTTELGETETISGTLKVNKAEITVESDGRGNLIYKSPEGYTGTSLDDLYTQWFEAENPGKKREENGLEFKKWQVKQGIIVETVFEVENGREGNVKTNENLRKAIQNAISNGIDESKITDLKGSKAFEVELDNDIKVTIPKEKLQLGADGKPLPESIQDYLNENFNTIDLDLKDTISRAITEAFTNLSTILSSLDSQPADNVATALQNIMTFATQALTAVTNLVNKIKELSALSNFEMPSSEDNKSSKKPGRKNESGFDANSARGQAEAYRKELEEVSSTEVKNTAEFDTSMATSNATNLWAILEQIINAEIQIAIELTQDTEHSKIVLEQIRNLLDEIEGKKNKQIQIDSNSVTAATAAVSELKKEIDGEHTMTVTAVLNSSAVDGYTPPNKTAYVNYVPVMSGGAPSGGSTGSVQGASQFLSKPPRATGNIGLAKAKGTQTLMGELGPELVVSNGHYFVAGQNGAEMVNLANDAIVFNHLQTEQLLKKGMSSGRGKAITSEKSAVAFAGGNINGGPAMASASAALAQLKKLRAMWESLKNASVSDLAGAGGGGGGGGGGGDNAKVVDPSIWVDTVERWYNLMQKIAKLEKEITHEETLRSKLQSDWNANGNHYYASQKRSLEALRDQIDAQEQLNLSREAYYDQRVEALKNQPFGKLIEFDNEGQMRFQKGAMEWLTDLAGFDSLGKANYTDEEKYNILVSAGYGDYMKYSEGGEIKMDGDSDGEITDEERQSFYGEATKAFWDKIDEYKEATQSLWDSIKEGEEDLLKLQADQNKLLEEIRENQMAVEDAVLEAIEDMRQRQIDALQDERDKLEESTQKYIDGLTDALNNEKQMYENQEDESNLNQQKRRLAILQRSGGSAQDIANLRSEINQSERERYFNLQQQQIDAIQQASELEIERMDSQIELMTETLEYQKEYGLLWSNVYEVMQGTAQEITSFIINGNSGFWASSELATNKAINEQLFGAEQWTSYRDDLNTAKAAIGENGITAKDIKDNVQLMVTMTRQQMRDKDYTIFDEAMKKEFGAGYDASGTYKNLFYSEYMQHGDITKATATARAKYAADKAAAEAAARAAAAAKAAPAPAPVASSGGGGGSGSSKTCADCAVNCGGACYNACENACSKVCRAKTNQDVYVMDCNGTCKGTAKGHTGSNSMAGNPYSTKDAYGSKKKAAGGYVNHGLYELGELGTETVLTASQTKILRDNILSNRPNSLISLLKSYNENYDGISNPLNDLQSPIEDNSIVIERVEMTMDVKQLANDYDARRAGEQALNEMMRIARKTSAANSIRR